MKNQIAICSLCSQTKPVDSQHIVYTCRVYRSSRKTGFKETTHTTMYLEKQQHSGCICVTCKKKADHRKKLAFLISAFILVWWLGGVIGGTIASHKVISSGETIFFTTIQLALVLLLWGIIVRGLYRWANIEHQLVKRFAKMRKAQGPASDFKGFTGEELRLLEQSRGNAFAEGVSPQKCPRCGTTIESSEITCSSCGKTDFTSLTICLTLGAILIAAAALWAQQLTFRLLWGLAGVVCMIVGIGWILKALRSHGQ